MKNEIKVKEQFYKYLTEEFGEEFTGLIEPPEGVEIGERVLFKLNDGNTAVRHEVTQQETEAFHQMLVTAVGDIKGTRVITEPPVSSGLPYPRMVDISDWTIAWDNAAKEYLTSDSLLPKKGFSIEWLFGVVFSSKKRLVYIDFTHPKVKVILSFVYEEEPFISMLKTHLMSGVLHRFKVARRTLIAEAENTPDLLWAKMVQVDEAMLEQKNMRSKANE